MTVCIAAICTHYSQDFPPTQMIVGASDRMYTAGDWTYEPNQTKHFNFLGQFTNRATALVAGVAAENLSICMEAQRRVIANADESIQRLAETYAEAFADYRRAEAERKMLYPLGLTLDTYGRESPDRVKQLGELLKRWELDDAAIITGYDAAGVHVWEVADPGWPRCHDAIGFTAVGSGSGHAAAEFMRVRFDRQFSVARTLLLAYRAKKAAEVDPFVGKDTDLFVITNGATIPPGLHVDLYAEVVRAHNRLESQERKARSKADEAIEASVEKHLRKQAQSTIEQEDARGGDEPKRLHDGAQEGQP